MENNYARRLIEVDMPIRRISAHARREKNIRQGNISTLHIWWARRPLAACRAVLCAALWFDPCDPLCPASFRKLAREAMRELAQNNLRMFGAESLRHFSDAKRNPSLLVEDEFLRSLLFDFIADFANWDNSINDDFLEAAQFLTHVAHLALSENLEFQEAFAEYENDHSIENLKSKIENLPKPLVVDPFAGGGAIPLEALRVGADDFASDLNPVAVLLNKVILEYIPKYGKRLANAVREYGELIKNLAEAELGEFYPTSGNETPIAYLWARTVQCEGPGCGAEVPLMRSLWLAKKERKSYALQFIPDLHSKRVDFEIIKQTQEGWRNLEDNSLCFAPKFEGTVRRGNAVCPVCGFTTPVKSVRKQLLTRKGGANDARLICIVYTRENQQGRFYRLPNKADLQAVEKATIELERRKQAYKIENPDGLSFIPDEPTPASDGHRAVGSLQIYGVSKFGDMFTSRQLLALTSISAIVKKVCSTLRESSGEPDFALAVQTFLGLAISRFSDICNAFCRWETSKTQVRNLFARQALPMIWDFAEPAIFSDDAAGNFAVTLGTMIDVIEKHKIIQNQGQIEKLSAISHSLPDEYANAFITDPPYYDSVPYADVADFFYVWLKRTVPNFSENGLLTPKKEQAIVWHPNNREEKAEFESKMEKAMSEGRRILQKSGIGTVVFAHKTTTGWETQLRAMVNAGWTITGSWAIDTELGNRMNAQGTAALASSIHLVCRPRLSQSVGDYGQVLLELPRRINEWLPRLASEGIVGADAIFACLGPALEIFSRYERVERTNGETVGLREYLEVVWAAVAKEALSMIFAGADASGFEPDARITAMWLWTLSTAKDRTDLESRVINAMNPDEESDAEDDEDEENSGGKKKVKGFVLEYDAARKIAQGLGVNLDAMEICEVKGETARLLPVKERARQLFGSPADETMTVVATRGRRKAQQSLFGEMEEAMTATVSGWHLADESRRGATVLDRLHQAMIFFAAGRGEALRRFLVDDGVGADERIWRLANALSALYPKSSEEKRWVDGILAKKKGLGF